jgi:hypothetical protein
MMTLLKKRKRQQVKSYERDMRIFLGSNWRVLSRRHKIFNVPLSKFDRAAIKYKLEKDG